MTKQLSYVQRFSLAQRIEHIILVASFSILGLTGLPQKFAGSGVAEWAIGVLGGIEMVRNIHHVAAIVFTVEAIYHIILLGYKLYVRRIGMSMLPGLKDVTDAWAVVRYNLGLTKQLPLLPRYNFEEKAEYWAMIWGTLVMAATGFVLWNPIMVSKVLPGVVIPASKAAHGGEAVLAVLAILVWHFYNVHLKSFNTSMWTGRLSRKHMEHEHGRELAELEAGQSRLQSEAKVVRRRRTIYAPVAIVMALVPLLVVYWLATAETTAITTVPKVAARVTVYAPLTPTSAPTRAATAVPAQATAVPGATAKATTAAAATSPSAAAGVAAAIPHVVAGREQCDACHAIGSAANPMPANHAGRTNATCIACHPAGAATAATVPAAAGSATAVPAATAGTGTSAGAATATPAKAAGPVATAAPMKAEVCMGCHPFTQLIALKVMVKANANDETANVHTYVPHAKRDAVNIPDCNNCHKPHTVPLTDPSTVEKANANFCYACHHEQSFTPCIACHSNPEGGG